MVSDPLASAKRAAALAAAAEVESGMLVGLGTGTTAAFLIEALGARMRAGLRIRTVATSIATADHARALGLHPLDMSDVAAIDLAIDGVDEIDSKFRAIKGGGGAMLREKIVASSAARMIAIADGSKQTDELGKRPLPIEVLPFARAFLERAVVDLGGVPRLRAMRSDQGNLLIDCSFGSITDPTALAASLDAIPGLLGHGLFLTEIDALYLAIDTEVFHRERREARGV